MKFVLVLLMLSMCGCVTANVNVCPMGDQSTSCKCWRGELTGAECHNWDRMQRP